MSDDQEAKTFLHRFFEITGRTLFLMLFMNVVSGIVGVQSSIPISTLRVSVGPLTQLPVDGHRSDLVNLDISIDGDFRPVWNWNVKEVHVSCVATVKRPSTGLDALPCRHSEQTVIWRTHLKSIRESKIDAGFPSQIGIDAADGSLKDMEIRLTLEWHTELYLSIPFMKRRDSVSSQETFRTPNEYTFTPAYIMERFFTPSFLHLREWEE
mmetsp:Transcript_6276/g.9509  ORF Transcript_6276/g.9509 Transcript_6276/m.9509 type:complete len:210 (-) Transcript_6276:21-650(-)